MAKVRRRKDRDCWEADYIDSTGKRRRVTAPTREEAEDVLAKAIQESRRPAPEKDADMRLDAYATQWLQDVEAEGSLAKRTLQDYRYNLTKHVLPSIGHFRVKDITPSAVRTLLRKKRERGLGKNSVRLIRAALSVVLSDAVEDGLLQTNPAINKGGRRKRAGVVKVSDRVRNIRPMSYDQKEAFLEAAHDFDPFYGVLFETAVKTGVRPGELRALKVEDLDPREPKLLVDEAVSEGEIKDTKTSTIREVDLSPELDQLLREYVTQLRAEALRLGWGEPSWLFPSATNTPLDQANVDKVYKRILKRAKLPSFRLYDLRHTCICLLLARCAPITYVSAQVGNSPQTLLTYYARWIPSEQTFVHLLDSTWNQNMEPSDDQEVVNDANSLTVNGEPRRNRTFNLRIKSRAKRQTKNTHGEENSSDGR